MACKGRDCAADVLQVAMHVSFGWADSVLGLGVAKVALLEIFCESVGALQMPCELC